MSQITKISNLKKQLDFNWFIWLILIVLWNFGFPNATAILDVFVSVVLSFLLFFLKMRKN